MRFNFEKIVRFSPGTFLLLDLLILFSCSGTDKKVLNSERIKTDTAVISFAKRLNIERHDGYSLLQIKDPWQGAGNVNHKWYLVPRGSKPPAGLEESQIIPIPVKKIVCMSTTYIPMIRALGEEQSIIGISGSRYIYDSDFLSRRGNKEIYDVGYDENLNKELLLSISPELVIAYGVGSESEGYVGKLRDLDIKIIYNADYLENDPLAKAEWIKFFGFLFEKDSLASEIFQSIEEEYMRLREYISENIDNRPSVLLGLPYRDSWYISPGNSYVARIISDAGGRYIWNDLKSDITLPYSFESVFVKAISADFWLNTGNASSLEEIAAIDPRFRKLKCFQNGDIYNNNKRVSREGGNDYWESGAFNPQTVLKDIASILHPELFSGYTLYYYKKLN